MFKNLFVPIDGSALSERAMQTSIALAKQLGAAITGFVVEPDAPLPTPGVQMSQYERSTAAHLEKTDTHARKLLTAFEARAAESGVPFTGLHANATGVDQAIVEQAESAGCDMIVMVTHGRGTFGELLFGSHTKTVLSHSKLPLLVLH
ncbi:universal stress protein [Aquabacterium sp. OR-4]|uniref:universal stress protein n=1 Tax=Aquabacterium sp. OR-4 TaxID=2978127 RepID=UPI0021B171B5|nr:universal stress protein [Aquabacterium sp. OR-4]MDT7837390.1 universal stress protein [Aquabacterium sp. OR-4]